MDKQEEEIWKDIPGYEGRYQVNNMGMIISLPRVWFNGYRDIQIKSRLMRQRVEKDGYPTVLLYRNGKGKRYRIHNLVASAFMDKPDHYDRIVINHINGNKCDNRLLNLEYVTSRENCSVKFRKNSEKSTSKYIGVYSRKKYNGWFSSISDGLKTIHLGHFYSEEEARDAYLNALYEINEKRRIKHEATNNKCHLRSQA